MADTTLLAKLLAAELSKGISREQPLVVSKLTRIERTELAELLAGTSEKRSSAYKAARRNVERWEKGRKPMPISLARLTRAGRERNALIAAYRGRGADTRVLVDGYGNIKGWLPPHGWLHLPREAMRRIIRYWAEGDHELAAGAYFDAFLAAYRVPNYETWAMELTVVDLRLRPTAG